MITTKRAFDDLRGDVASATSIAAEADSRATAAEQRITAAADDTAARLEAAERTVATLRGELLVLREQFLPDRAAELAAAVLAARDYVTELATSLVVTGNVHRDETDLAEIQRRALQLEGFLRLGYTDPADLAARVTALRRTAADPHASNRVNEILAPAEITYGRLTGQPADVAEVWGTRWTWNEQEPETVTAHGH